MHEVENYQSGFADRDGQSDDCVELSQIDEGYLDGDESQDHQRGKDGEIDLLGYDVLRHGF